MKYVNKNEIKLAKCIRRDKLSSSEILSTTKKKINFFNIHESQVFEFYARCFIFTILIMCNLVTI